MKIDKEIEVIDREAGSDTEPSESGERKLEERREKKKKEETKERRRNE